MSPICQVCIKVHGRDTSAPIQCPKCEKIIGCFWHNRNSNHIRECGKTASTVVITQKELELAQEVQALKAYEREARELLGALVGGLMLWMVGWRGSLAPEARAQMEAMIAEYSREAPHEHQT